MAQSCEPKNAVAVLILSSDGYVPLVRDLEKPAPVFWKLPGGRGQEGESAIDTAVREVFEETGIALEPRDLIVLDEEDRGSHVRTLFFARKEFSVLKLQGNGGEDVARFTLKDLQSMADFFPNHRIAIEKCIASISSKA